MTFILLLKTAGDKLKWLDSERIFEITSLEDQQKRKQERALKQLNFSFHQLGTYEDFLIFTSHSSFSISMSSELNLAHLLYQLSRHSLNEESFITESSKSSSIRFLFLPTYYKFHFLLWSSRWLSQSCSNQYSQSPSSLRFSHHA